MKLQFKNASLVSAVNGSITIKDSTEKERTFTNASIISVNNGTIIIESEWEPKKGELVKAKASTGSYYMIFNNKTRSILNLFGVITIRNNWYIFDHYAWPYKIDVTLSPVTQEEQKEFDDFCKSQGKIWNKETLQWDKCRWEPTNDDIYFYIDMDGLNLKIFASIWNNNIFDQEMYDAGNCFKTQKEAQIKINKIRNLFKE